MEKYKGDFIEFMVRSGALKFGQFVTKSGRKTPFFVNTGCYDTGKKLADLGLYYASAILNQSAKLNFDFLFGPAYKGIPLVSAVAVTLSYRWDCNYPFAFNRKETKDHGEGGTLIGYKPKEGESALIIEDVTTAGTSVRETIQILKAIKAKVSGLVVSVDRQERGQGQKSALAELHDEFGIETFAIVTLDEIIEHLHGHSINSSIVLDDEVLAAIKDYRRQYGATA